MGISALIQEARTTQIDQDRVLNAGTMRAALLAQMELYNNQILPSDILRTNLYGVPITLQSHRYAPLGEDSIPIDTSNHHVGITTTTRTTPVDHQVDVGRTIPITGDIQRGWEEYINNDIRYINNNIRNVEYMKEETIQMLNQTVIVGRIKNLTEDYIDVTIPALKAGDDPVLVRCLMGAFPKDCLTQMEVGTLIGVKGSLIMINGVTSVKIEKLTYLGAGERPDFSEDFEEDEEEEEE